MSESAEKAVGIWFASLLIGIPAFFIADKYGMESNLTQALSFLIPYAVAIYIYWEVKLKYLFLYASLLAAIYCIYIFGFPQLVIDVGNSSSASGRGIAVLYFIFNVFVMRLLRLASNKFSDRRAEDQAGVFD